MQWRSLGPRWLGVVGKGVVRTALEACKVEVPLPGVV